MCRRKNTKFFIKWVTISILSAIVGGIIGWMIVPKFLYGKYIDKPFYMNPHEEVEIVSNYKDVHETTKMIQKVMPSVVGITTVTLRRDMFYGIQAGESIGTGVIVDERGYVLTNSHVVEDGQSSKIQVLLSDGRKLKGKVLWQDSFLDLAVVKVKAKGLKVATLGDSDALEVGTLSLAIGNPIGLEFERSVTSGIISALNRSVAVNQYDTIEGLIQTDASINPGNSGGPLLNQKGEIIGINTARLGEIEGVGFAIPINIAKPIVDEFIKKGEFEKVALGIKGIGIKEYKDLLRKDMDIDLDQGVLVYEVIKNTAAHRAGLKSGDVILSMNDTTVNTMSQLVRFLYKHRPNDQVTAKILRDDKRINLSITLEAAKE